MMFDGYFYSDLLFYEIEPQLYTGINDLDILNEFVIIVEDAPVAQQDRATVS